MKIGLVLGVFISLAMVGILVLLTGTLQLIKRKPMLVRSKDIQIAAVYVLVPLWIGVIVYSSLATPSPVDQSFAWRCSIVLGSVLSPLPCLAVISVGFGDLAVFSANRSMILESLENVLSKQGISYVSARQLSRLGQDTEYVIELVQPKGQIKIKHSEGIDVTALHFSGKHSIPGYSEFVAKLDTDLKARQVKTLVGAYLYLFFGLMVIAGDLFLLWFVITHPL